MTKDEALRLALEALQTKGEHHPRVYAAMTAIKAALEANEFNPDWDTQAVLVEEIQRMAKRIEELEAQRTWVGLTDEEIEDFVSALWPVGAGAGKLLRAIEAKLKEKNHA
jgi:uncharacterized coiled-coil protein SlyX